MRAYLGNFWPVRLALVLLAFAMTYYLGRRDIDAIVLMIDSEYWFRGVVFLLGASSAVLTAMLCWREPRFAPAYLDVQLIVFNLCVAGNAVSLAQFGMAPETMLFSVAIAAGLLCCLSGDPLAHRLAMFAASCLAIVLSEFVTEHLYFTWRDSPPREALFARISWLGATTIVAIVVGWFVRRSGYRIARHGDLEASRPFQFRLVEMFSVTAIVAFGLVFARQLENELSDKVLIALVGVGFTAWLLATVGMSPYDSDLQRFAWISYGMSLFMAVGLYVVGPHTPILFSVTPIDSLDSIGRTCGVVLVIAVPSHVIFLLAQRHGYRWVRNTDSPQGGSSPTVALLIVGVSLSIFASPVESGRPSVVFDIHQRIRTETLRAYVAKGDLLVPVDALRGARVSLKNGERVCEIDLKAAYVCGDSPDAEFFDYILLQTNAMSKEDALGMARRLMAFAPAPKGEIEKRIAAWVESDEKDRLIINSEEGDLTTSIIVCNSFSIDESRPWTVNFEVGWRK